MSNLSNGTVTSNITGAGNVTTTTTTTTTTMALNPVIDWQGWTTLSLIGAMLVALVAEMAPPYMVMMGTLIIFLPLGILDIYEAFQGFADEAMLSVAVLFVVARGIELSGGLEYVSSFMFSTKKIIVKPGQRVWKSAKSVVWVLLKLSLPVAIFSAFLANIPLVAMMIPPIVEYAKKVNMAPSKLLLPLSFAALLGGTMTLIGASTNLIVLSMAAKKVPDLKMNLFEIGVVGVPITVAGLLYILALSGSLLPDRLSRQNTTINAREYSVVLVVKPLSSLAKKTVELAGLNRQPGLTLLQIERDGQSNHNPPGDFSILPKDHLHFIGTIDSVLSLTQLDGLALSEDEGQEQVDLNQLTVNQRLVEAVVAAGSPMVRRRVAELQFRARYKAAIVAVHRHATVIDCPIGKLELHAGDCLLMVADGPEFVAKHRNNSTFALVSKLPGFVPIQRGKAVIAAVLVLAMVIATAVGVELITAALFSCAGLLICRCLTPRDAMDALEMPVLIMISAAFGISEAMVQSGAAHLVARALMGLAGKSLFGLITCTYVATTVFSLAITNNAAVTIMFPVALAAAAQQNLDFRPFAYTLMMASSAGFMTPTGCPTNIMVYAPGGYKFSDYMKYGGPLQIWLLIVTVGVTVTIHYWWAWWIVLIPLTVGLTPLLASMSCNMPKTKSIAATSSESPSTPLNLSTDSAALDLGESSLAHTPTFLEPSQATQSHVDTPRDASIALAVPPQSHVDTPQHASIALALAPQSNVDTPRHPSIIRAQQAQQFNVETPWCSPSTRRKSSVSRALVPNQPVSPVISMEKIQIQPQGQPMSQKQIQSPISPSYRKVSGFAMTSWTEPPSSDYPSSSSQEGAVLKERSFSNYKSLQRYAGEGSVLKGTTLGGEPPPPYPGDGPEQKRIYTAYPMESASSSNFHTSVDMEAFPRPSRTLADSMDATTSTSALRSTSVLDSELVEIDFGGRRSSIEKMTPAQRLSQLYDSDWNF